MTAPTRQREHYSYAVYADPATARSFDSRRFSGPIGELIAETQANVLASFIGTHSRPADSRCRHRHRPRGAAGSRSSGAEVTGVDASEEMLAVARKRAAEQGAGVRFLTGDAHALEFPDRSFDVVVSLRVLMHSPEWPRSVAELCRVAERSGRPGLSVQEQRGAFSSRWCAASCIGSVRGRSRTASLRIGRLPMRLADRASAVRSLHRQFVLPIAFHKAVGSRAWTVRIESALDRLGLLKLFGSPVTLVAERCVYLVTGATGFTGGHLARALVARGGRCPRTGAEPCARRAAPTGRHRCSRLAMSAIGRLCGPPWLASTSSTTSPPCIGRPVFQTRRIDPSMRRRVGDLVEAARTCRRRGGSCTAAPSACTATSSIRPRTRTRRSGLATSTRTTKLEGERLARAAAARSGVELTIVRPTGIYGPGDRRLLKLFRGVARRTMDHRPRQRRNLLSSHVHR